MNASNVVSKEGDVNVVTNTILKDGVEHTCNGSTQIMRFNEFCCECNNHTPKEPTDRIVGGPGTGYVMHVHHTCFNSMKQMKLGEQCKECGRTTPKERSTCDLNDGFNVGEVLSNASFDLDFAPKTERHPVQAQKPAAAPQSI